MPLLRMPSGKELEENREFKLLPESNVIFEVASIEVEHGKTSQWSPEPHDEWKVKAKAISFDNGEPLYYDDGTDPEPGKDVTKTFWVDPNRVGTKPVASKARRFLTAVLAIGVEDAIEVESFDDLIGKRFLGRIQHKDDAKGIKRDPITDFQPIRSRRQRPKPTTETVEASAEEMLSKAKEVFGDDLKF